MPTCKLKLIKWNNFLERKCSALKNRNVFFYREKFSIISILRNNKFSQIDEIQIKVGSDANAIRNCVFVFFFWSHFRIFKLATQQWSLSFIRLYELTCVYWLNQCALPFLHTFTGIYIFHIDIQYVRATPNKKWSVVRSHKKGVPCVYIHEFIENKKCDTFKKNWKNYTFVQNLSAQTSGGAYERRTRALKRLIGGGRLQFHSIHYNAHTHTPMHLHKRKLSRRAQTTIRVKFALWLCKLLTFSHTNADTAAYT